MKENGNLVKLLVRANSFTLMEIFMKGIGLTTKLMAMVFIQM